jgi:hypothetical protein
VLRLGDKIREPTRRQIFLLGYRQQDSTNL